MPSSGNNGPILAFFCNWAPYKCYMEAAKSERPLPPRIRPIKVMCSGRVDAALILSAYEKGAEGVMVIGCGEEECRYGPGPGQARKTVRRVRELLHILGLEPERLSHITLSSHETEGLLEGVHSFVKRISTLKRSPLTS